MLGTLNTEMIEVLLHTQPVGRIGCFADGLVYIVPVNFAYDPPFIYAHSSNGLKIDMMRKNPDVCFELDKIENIFNWQSVICWGKFEELTSIEDSELAMNKILRKIDPYLTIVDDAHPSHGITNDYLNIGVDEHLIVYRIKLSNKTGKFEKREFAAAHDQEK